MCVMACLNVVRPMLYIVDKLRILTFKINKIKGEWAEGYMRM